MSFHGSEYKTPDYLPVGPRFESQPLNRDNRENLHSNASMCVLTFRLQCLKGVKEKKIKCSILFGIPLINYESDDDCNNDQGYDSRYDRRGNHICIEVNSLKELMYWHLFTLIYLHKV